MPPREYFIPFILYSGDSATPRARDDSATRPRPSPLAAHADRPDDSATPRARDDSSDDELDALIEARATSWSDEPPFAPSSGEFAGSDSEDDVRAAEPTRRAAAADDDEETPRSVDEEEDSEAEEDTPPPRKRRRTTTAAARRPRGPPSGGHNTRADGTVAAWIVFRGRVAATPRSETWTFRAPICGRVAATPRPGTWIFRRDRPHRYFAHENRLQILRFACSAKRLAVVDATPRRRVLLSAQKELAGAVFAARMFRRRVAATPRLRRGYSAGASRGGGRGCDVDIWSRPARASGTRIIKASSSASGPSPLKKTPGTWAVRSSADGSRRRRGRDVEYSVETSRGDAAAATSADGS